VEQRSVFRAFAIAKGGTITAGRERPQVHGCAKLLLAYLLVINGVLPFQCIENNTAGVL
jgi:hypothetical protein